MKKTVLIALVPVIHIRYVELFKKYPEELYIISNEILKKWDGHKYLERDLRTLDQTILRDIIQKSGLVSNVHLLTQNNIDVLNNNSTELSIVMPDEDISHWLHDEFFSHLSVKFENIFLRWNKPVSTQELEVTPSRIISSAERDRIFIEKSQDLAKKSANWWRQIGALVVDSNDKILLSTFNRHVPTQQNIAVYGDLRSCFDAGEHHELSNSIHAEASLIALAAKNGPSLADTNLYVTTFPCPTCAKLVAEAGIKKVYYSEGYSLSDAEDILKASDIELIKVD